jgi:hypothetical protein
MTYSGDSKPCAKMQMLKDAVLGLIEFGSKMQPKYSFSVS